MPESEVTPPRTAPAFTEHYAQNVPKVRRLRGEAPNYGNGVTPL